MDEFINRLREGFKGDISAETPDLEKFSRDASFFKVMPKLAVFPKDAEDLKRLVNLVNEFCTQGKIFNLTARSAGTDMGGGPLGESIIVDFTKYFKNIKEIGSEFAVTEPGVYFRDFDKETLAKGYFMPAYPASREICTVGGMVGNNAGGEKTLEYGKVEDYVLEIKAVLQDGNEYAFRKLNLSELEEKKSLMTFEGEVYRKVHALIEKNYEKIMAAKPKVSKNSAGYFLWNVFDKQAGTFDLTKLLVGSQGTLGLTTEIKFKLVKPKTHSRLLIIFLKDLKQLGVITENILKFHPESIESYDDHTFRLALKLFPALLKKLKGNAILLLLRFIPDFWAFLTGGIPKLILMAEFTADNEEEAEKQALAAKASLEEFKLKSKIATSPEEMGKYWTIRRESFNMLRNHVKKMRTAPFIDDFVVQPEVLPQFLPELYKILDQYKIIYTVAGHVGSGNFHIIPLMDFGSAKTKGVVNDLMFKVNDLVFRYKGSMTGEHNDGIVRTPFLKAMFGVEIVKLFEDTKAIFDPHNIFNPRKKVDGTWKYALDHIIKE